ncbi:hypothetical protein MRX96_015581 [Rhipicephalus microplus]
MHNKIINPLTLFALLEAVAARPLLVQHGAPKPSRFDEYVTEPPRILGRAWLHEQTLSNSEDDVASNRAPAELAPAYGLRYHDVVYDASSETLDRYDGSDTREGTYYPSAYRADGHEPSGSLEVHWPQQFPHDDWLLLSTSQHDPHWDDVSTAYRVPPFTTAALRR